MVKEDVVKTGGGKGQERERMRESERSGRRDQTGNEGRKKTKDEFELGDLASR